MFSSKGWPCLASGQTLECLENACRSLTTESQGYSSYENLWELQLPCTSPCIPVITVPCPLPAPSLPSSISWPVYSECKCVHCVTAVILYCICLLKCGVKWILISEHRLIVHNQLCARVASSASLLFQDSWKLVSKQLLHTHNSASCLFYEINQIWTVLPIARQYYSLECIQNMGVFIFTLWFICCQGSIS